MNISSKLPTQDSWPGQLPPSPVYAVPWRSEAGEDGDVAGGAAVDEEEVAEVVVDAVVDVGTAESVVCDRAELDVELEIVTVAYEVTMMVVLTGGSAADGADVPSAMLRILAAIDPPASRPAEPEISCEPEQIIPAATG